MAVDIAAGVLVVLLLFWGLFRGLLSQVGGLIGIALLWVTFPQWFPHVDVWIAQIGPPIDEQPFVRKSLAFVGAYILWAAALHGLELLVVDSLSVLRWSNRLGGALVGAAKGLLFAILLGWGLHAAALWNKPPEQAPPAWIQESRFLTVVAPWNPVRVGALREIVDEVRAATESERPDRAKQLLKRLPDRPELQQAVKELCDDPRFAAENYVEMLRDSRIRAVLVEQWPSNPFFRRKD